MEKLTDAVPVRVFPVPGAPPPKKEPYVHVSLPAWRYHPVLGSKLCNTQKELDRLGSEWVETPFPVPEPVAMPPEIPAALRHAWDLLQAENRELREFSLKMKPLQEENAQLRAALADLARLEESAPEDTSVLSAMMREAGNAS